jgi:hypothetical protein
VTSICQSFHFHDPKKSYHPAYICQNSPNPESEGSTYIRIPIWWRSFSLHTTHVQSTQRRDTQSLSARPAGSLNLDTFSARDRVQVHSKGRLYLCGLLTRCRCEVFPAPKIRKRKLARTYLLWRWLGLASWLAGRLGPDTSELVRMPWFSYWRAAAGSSAREVAAAGFVAATFVRVLDSQWHQLASLAATCLARWTNSGRTVAN